MKIAAALKRFAIAATTASKRVFFFGHWGERGFLLLSGWRDQLPALENRHSGSLPECVLRFLACESSCDSFSSRFRGNFTYRNPPLNTLKLKSILNSRNPHAKSFPSVYVKQYPHNAAITVKPGCKKGASLARIRRPANHVGAGA